MPDIKSKTVHQREVTCFLSGAEVHALIEARALTLAGYQPGTPNLSVNVRIEDDVSALPPRRVGVAALVEIVETLPASAYVPGDVADPAEPLRREGRAAP